MAPLQSQRDAPPSPTASQVRGFDELIDLLRQLYRSHGNREPRFWQRVGALLGSLVGRRRPDRTPPIVCCVQDLATADAGLLTAVKDLLGDPKGKQGVPCVLAVLPDAKHRRQVAVDETAVDDIAVDGPTVDGPAVDAAVVRSVLAVLTALAAQLEVRAGGGYAFPRFRLVEWLMAQETLGSVGTGLPGRLQELRRRLRKRATGRVDVGETIPHAPVEGTLAKLRSAGVVLTPLFFRIRQSGRIPGFGRHYRWFLRQPDLAPALYPGFFDIAERLTPGEWETEDPEQVLRLVVNAFLEDLRDAFRAAGWVRLYRTTFPVVLLHRITPENGGWALLRGISAVRNETGLADPLLLVTTSRQEPGLTERPHMSRPVVRALDALKAWNTADGQQRRRRTVREWLLVVDVPRPSDTVEKPDPEPLVRPHRPLLRTRTAALSLTGTLLLVLVMAYTAFGLSYSDASCRDRFTWWGRDPLDASVTRIGGECIGVTRPDTRPVVPGAEFVRVRDVIERHNHAAEEAHASEPQRPLITLVFLGALSNATPATKLTAELEQLAGIAVVQKVQLSRSGQLNEPLVKVLIANAGGGMAHATEAVGQITRLAAQDPGIVAVVGLNESRKITLETIADLGRAGLPVVSATLSADELVTASPMYFQVAPQNARQADVAAAYLERLVARPQEFPAEPAPRPARKLTRVYVSDDITDLYSQNLAADLRASLGVRGFDVETVSFTPAGGSAGGAVWDRHLKDANLAGRDACGMESERGAVFYVGRPRPDFQAFVTGVTDGCQKEPPFILGGDDVTRYVADTELSSQNRAIPFRYMSFAVAPAASQQQSSNFYTTLAELFPNAGQRGAESLDGHAALTYDAAYAAVFAAATLRQKDLPVTPGTLWSALTLPLTDPPGFDGVTGRVVFSGDPNGQVLPGKPVAVVSFAAGAPILASAMVCAEDSGPDWCPPVR